MAGPFGLPRHTAGIADGEPGLYFVGLPFQTRPASALIGGMGEDAALVAGEIARRLHIANEPLASLRPVNVSS